MNNLRSEKKQICDVFLGDRQIKISLDELKQKYGFHSIIRFHKNEFALIKGDKLTHFNISHTNHEVGKIYALVSIEKGGSFDGKKEILPVLNLDNFIRGKCAGVRNNVPYYELTENDFKNSISSIKNVEELKDAILKRYKKSMSHISDEDKLKLGVGITEIELAKR